MYSLKQISFLSFLLLSVSAKDIKQTTIGLGTDKASRAIMVDLDDCHAINEDEVFTVSVQKYCRVFTGPNCTGRNTLLTPGDHSNEDPVPIESIYCHLKQP